MKHDYADKQWLIIEPVEIDVKLMPLIFFACIGIMVCGFPFLPLSVDR